MTEDRNRVDRRAPDEAAPDPAMDDIASIFTGEALNDDELDDLCEATLATVGSAKTQK